MTKNWTPDKGMPDLSGKVVVVTGANSGIGLHTAKHFAKHGAKVYFTTRSEAKAAQAKKVILAEVPTVADSQLIPLLMDLADAKSILRAVEELKAKERRVDILVNNAGVLINEVQTTKNGWEMHMAVNHTGHFIFTNGLLPLLKTASLDETSDVRIITVASDVPKVFFPPNYPLDFTTPSLLQGTLPYEPWQWRWISRHLFTVDMLHYSVSKFANVLFTKELQRRLDEQGSSIVTVCLNPGPVRSVCAEDMFSVGLKQLMSLIQLTPDQGSVHSLWAATAEVVRKEKGVYGGKYMEPTGNVQSDRPMHPVENDDKQVRALWDVTTKEVNVLLEQEGLGRLPEW